MRNRSPLTFVQGRSWCTTIHVTPHGAGYGPGGLAMDGLDVAMAGEIQRHRAPDPLWARIALVVGWSLVWVSFIALATIVGWKVIVPWLFVVS